MAIALKSNQFVHHCRPKMSFTVTVSPDHMEQIKALGAVEDGNDEIANLQNQVDRNNRRLVYIVRRVDDLVRQVELKNRTARSLLHGEADGDLLQMAEDMAADADHLLLEAAALNAKAANLSTTTESINQQIQRMLFVQTNRNLAMD